MNEEFWFLFLVAKKGAKAKKNNRKKRKHGSTLENMVFVFFPLNFYIFHVSFYGMNGWLSSNGCFEAKQPALALALASGAADFRADSRESVAPNGFTRAGTQNRQSSKTC